MSPSYLATFAIGIIGSISAMALIQLFRQFTRFRLMRYYTDRMRELSVELETNVESPTSVARVAEELGIDRHDVKLSLIHISEPTRPVGISRMPSSA